MEVTNKDRVYINACGIHVPIGDNVIEVAAALAKGARDGLTIATGLLHDRDVYVGAVQKDLPPVISGLKKFDCRNNRLMQTCLVQIQDAVQGAIKKYGADRVAVIIGTSTSGISNGEDALVYFKNFGQWPDNFNYLQQEISGLSQFVATYFDVSGPAYTIATACSSSAKVFASGRRLIRAGIVDAVIVGGADTLCQMTLNGFNLLELLSQTQCQPFSANRDGITIGEGAAAFLISKDEAAVELLGVGETSDAYHQTSPDPDGAGAQKAMMLAIEDAGLSAEDIDYINLHGTATRLNDAMEARAVFNVFGNKTPCSSTKSMTGHMLGAAGACEAAFLWMMLNPATTSGYLPPHVWDGACDSQDPHINLLKLGQTISSNVKKYMLSNSFGFGGSNVSLVLGSGK